MRLTMQLIVKYHTVKLQRGHKVPKCVHKNNWHCSPLSPMQNSSPCVDKPSYEMGYLDFTLLSNSFRLVYPTPDQDPPHIYVFEYDTEFYVGTCYYLATHHDPYAGRLKLIAFLLGAFTKSSSTKIDIQKLHLYHLTLAMNKQLPFVLA
jgi:hypothetical protein